jgi:hypothetical protein
MDGNAAGAGMLDAVWAAGTGGGDSLRGVEGAPVAAICGINGASGGGAAAAATEGEDCARDAGAGGGGFVPFSKSIRK